MWWCGGGAAAGEAVLRWWLWRWRRWEAEMAWEVVWTTSSSASTCFFRDRVRVRVSPDFVGGVRMGSTPSEATAPVPAEDVLVQYVVLRRDLIDAWPLGSVVTQGCHASVAAVWSHKDDPHTVDYCSPTNIDSMHKVTLEVKGETQLLNLSEKLRAGGIAHKLWIEQPENIPTCLATKPYPKSMVSSFFKKLKLCK
ncbi:hypothetical protein RHGRI_021210 [Rhododendron griersonianum]|uniref:peptidyl-tRNA hydrolase n=1 Tax=Rhododendron griersonianum TaxID=479676 RepID=A0AAV6JJC2_9ERIC|nr:hypothetical protein RHGRI_021210 [Rhododendron griersonianum]